MRIEDLKATKTTCTTQHFRITPIGPGTYVGAGFTSDTTFHPSTQETKHFEEDRKWKNAILALAVQEV